MQQRTDFECFYKLRSQRVTLLLLLIGGTLGGCAHYITDLNNTENTELKFRLEHIPHINVSYVKQLDAVTCGLAALQSVAQYWGVVLDQSQLFKTRPPKNTESGYSLGELSEFATEAGFTAFVIRADQAFLEKQISKGRPLIVALKIKPLLPVNIPNGLSGLVVKAITPSYNHFVVLMGIGNDQVAVMDPVQGYYLLNIDEFNEMWKKMSNVVLLAAR